MCYCVWLFWLFLIAWFTMTLNFWFLTFKYQKTRVSLNHTIIHKVNYFDFCFVSKCLHISNSRYKPAGLDFLPLSLCSSRTSSTSRLSSTIFTSSSTVVTLSIEVCWSFSLGSTVLLEVGEFISLSNSTSDSSKAESSAALSYSWSLWKTKRNAYRISANSFLTWIVYSFE